MAIGVLTECILRVTNIERESYTSKESGRKTIDCDGALLGPWWGVFQDGPADDDIKIPSDGIRSDAHSWDTWKV